MTASRRLTGYVFLLPYLALFLVFMVLPLLYGLTLSFQKYEMLTREPPTFVGLANYHEALLKPNPDGTRGDPLFYKALWATARCVLMAVPATVGLALLLAAGIDSLPPRRAAFYRLCVFIPTMVTISVAGILWRWFYNSQFGVFNAILGLLHIKPVNWITDIRFAMPALVVMTVWWTVGGPTVILLAGLKQIPDVYYEAAALDGADGWRRCFYVTLPMLKPVLLFVVVLNVIGAFQVFGQPYIVTRGEPELSTRVLVYYIYDTAFNFYRMGYGSAMSWLLFLIIVVFSLVQFRVLRER
jgi:multiple sugar transport system permease protein